MDFMVILFRSFRRLGSLKNIGYMERSATDTEGTVFENRRKSLIICLHLGQKFIKNAKNSQFGEFLKS